MAKAKFTNMSSLFMRSHSNQSRTDTNNDDIVKESCLTKGESNKSKYFVLRRETSKESPACLEYYENENKFRDGYQPRKRYMIKDCYISRKAIEGKPYAFGLFINSKKCSKTLIAKSEDELQDWMSKLNSLKGDLKGRNNSGIIENDLIWIVEIMHRGVASSQKLAGECMVFLNNRSLRLMIAENDTREIPLNSIKHYGRTKEYFFLEVGRQSGIGAGNLWMKTEDSYIAQNMADIIKDATERYGTLSQGKEGQDSFDSVQQRIRVNSLSGTAHPPGCTSRPRNRACSESCTSVLPRIVTGGTFFRSSNLPLDALHTPSREFPASARLLTSSEEDNIGRHFRPENEYVYIKSNEGESPSIDFVNSPTSEILPRSESSVNAYLEMGPTNSSYSIRNTSNPIPIVKQSGNSLQHEISPQSGNSSATSATTSSDHMHDLEGTSGSESLVGSCFGANELLDRPVQTSSERPIRTSSVGSKPDQYKRKNSAPMLAWSPASHSWSGTSGTYFRNLTGIIQSRTDDTMMIDYSNPNISHDEKEKKGFWSSCSQRLRSNSKTSRSSNVKISDSKDDTKPMDIPIKKRSDDYWEIDYQGRTSSQEFKGYLPMTAQKTRIGNSLERKMRLEMTPTVESVSDGYVDMRQSGSSLSISEISNPLQINLNPANREIQDHLPPDKISKKNNRKCNKSKSTKDSSKQRSVDKFTQGSPDTATKSKGTFSAFRQIIRKTSNSKSPVNTHPVKPSPQSPISSLPRRRSKDRQDEVDTGKVLPSSLPLSFVFSKSNEKLEEKMLFVPRDDPIPSQLRKISELYIADGESVTRHDRHARHSLVDTPDYDNRNYVNLSLNSSSPQINQYGRQPSFPEVTPRVASGGTAKNEGYLLMSSTIANSPLNTDRHTETRLQPDSHNVGERSRSLSGPGAPVDTCSAKEKKNPGECTTSASSSPTSRSPPVSPELGSVSSLSEGGLSSASSTCTVVNVGTNRKKYPSGSNPQTTCPTKTGLPPDPDKSRPASLTINYASLDLTKTPEGSPRPGRKSRDSSKDSNYCEIDFVKSEGLRNTSIARNSTCQ